MVVVRLFSMKEIIFVCHGNICRSVMAEYIFKYYNRNKEYNCFSRATSTEEIGNDIYYKAKETLLKNHIPFSKHYAKQITAEEYNNAELIIIMDHYNYSNLQRMLPNMDKVHYLKEYSLGSGDIEDPWYSNKFDLVFEEITSGVLSLINSLK